jgi:YggT family protein
MNAILDFVEYLISWALQLMIWIVVAWAILSWLVGFQVVNLRNRFVYQASRILDSLARPILAPIQRLLPPMGGMDFSPLVFIVVVAGIQRFLMPALFNWLHMLASPGGVI